MRLQAVYKGDRYELPNTGLKEFVMLERQFGIGAQAVTDNPRMEYMVFLAYCGLKRLGVVAHKYSDEFLEDLEGIEPIEEEGDEASDPTGAASQPQG